MLFRSKVPEPPVVTLSTSQLRRVQLLGGGTLRVSEIRGLEADLSMSGNGELTVDRADVERLVLYVGGGGRMTIAGSARDVRASINGPGALDAARLDTRNATVANDGVGSVHMRVSGAAKVVSTGSGDTIVEGNAICTVVRKGSGPVTCGN